MTSAIFAFTLTACLNYEFIAFRRDLSIDEARHIQRVELAYGISTPMMARGVGL